MRDIVAIIGSHPDTRGEFDFGRTDCDVWVFNEVVSNGDWCPRADVVFQLHKPPSWRIPGSSHYQWLKTTDTLVYMIEQYEDVPAAVKYPLDKVLALTPGYVFLTSSVAHAIGLAIVQGYKRIEIYGVEMETSTEYVHQQPGVAFWVGFGLGRGIEVVHHTKKFYTQPIYGFEGSHTITIEQLKKRESELLDKVPLYRELFQEALNAIEKALITFVDNYQSGWKQIEGLVNGMSQKAHDYGAVESASQLIRYHIDRATKMKIDAGSYQLDRQAYETDASKAKEDYDKAMIKFNLAAVELGKIFGDFEPASMKARRKIVVDLFREQVAVYARTAVEVGTTAGIIKESYGLLMAHDKITAAAGITEVKDDKDEV